MVNLDLPILNRVKNILTKTEKIDTDVTSVLTKLAEQGVDIDSIITSIGKSGDQASAATIFGKLAGLNDINVPVEDLAKMQIEKYEIYLDGSDVTEQTFKFTNGKKKIRYIAFICKPHSNVVGTIKQGYMVLNVDGSQYSLYNNNDFYGNGYLIYNAPFIPSETNSIAIIESTNEFIAKPPLSVNVNNSFSIKVKIQKNYSVSGHIKAIIYYE